MTSEDEVARICADPVLLEDLLMGSNVPAEIIDAIVHMNRAVHTVVKRYAEQRRRDSIHY